MKSAVISQKQGEHQRTMLPPATPARSQAASLHPVLQLQQQIGNQAVLRMLSHTKSPAQTKPMLNRSADQNQQEADRVAGEATRLPQPSPAPPSLPIQAKLEVGAVDDPLEREADRIAEQVMRMPEPGSLDDTAAPDTSMSEHRQMRLRPAAPQISRAASSSMATGMIVPPIVHEVLRSPGQPLDPGTRAFMEERFGYDFSRVRVHTNTRAVESTRAVDADAYTVGSEIVFAKAEHASMAGDGGWLLGHELAHVVQQGSDEPVTAGVIPEAIAENSAKHAAESITRGTAVPSQPKMAAGLARQARTGANPAANLQQKSQDPNVFGVATALLEQYERNPDAFARRVRELAPLAKLIFSTRLEFDELAPDYGVLFTPGSRGGGRSVNQPMIDAYTRVRSELEDYLSEYSSFRVGTPEWNLLLKGWSEALYELGELRKTLAGNVVVHYTGAIADKQQELKGLTGRLKAQNDSLKAYNKEVERIEKVGHDIAFVGDVGDALEILDKASENVEQLLEVEVEQLLEVEMAEKVGYGVFGAMMGTKLDIEIYAMRYQAKVIDQNIEKIQEAAKRNAIAIEGYQSLDALTASMEQAAKNIADTEATISMLAGQRDKAQFRESQPAMGAKQQ
jgi:Domain of unknown function (DUF4157)